MYASETSILLDIAEVLCFLLLECSFKDVEPHKPAFQWTIPYWDFRRWLQPHVFQGHSIIGLNLKVSTNTVNVCGFFGALKGATVRNVRFELGIRSLGVSLTDDKKGEPFNGSFIGSIYKLKAKQNWVPIHPFAQLEFALPGGLWLGAGATYSHLDVETLDDGGGDGDIESDLVLAYAILEYPTEHLRPYAEAGGGWAFNTFDAIGSWSAGNRREFVLEDSPVWMVGGGLGLILTDHFTLDAHVRYVHFDVDGTYVFRGDSRPDTDFTFTPSYVAAGLGISYAF